MLDDIEITINPDASRFIAEVERILRTLDSGDVTQDELDLFLLGGTIPPRLISMPKNDCRDCRGTGTVCVCHGIEGPWAQLDHNARVERCKCYSIRNNPEYVERKS